MTGGTWPADVSYGHVRSEKGVGFVPGGEIPTNIRTTAGQFMGQEIPQNYGKLVFGFPLASEVDFDPAQESVHGLLAEGSQEREESAQDNQPMAEGSQEREESAQDNQPMQNPYEQPSRRAGSSLQREEPAGQWEQQRSSSGSSEPPEEQVEVPPDDQPEQEATPTHGQGDPQEDEPMGEEVVNLWEAEDPPDEDFIVEHVTRSSISASNPWVCMRPALFVLEMKMDRLKRTLQVRKVVVLREWGKLLGPQRVALRRQSIGHADWEKLPWTGHLCYLFTRSWEIGRLRAHYHKERAHYHKERNFEGVRLLLEQCRYYWTDWLRGQGEPLGWDDRFDIDRDQWHEHLLLYERDLMIQADLEWLVEAVFTFYRKHLDKLIRENGRMWGDFCKKKYDDDGNEIGLELNTFGYDLRNPNVEVPMNKKTVIPDREKHFSWQLSCTNKKLHEISVTTQPLLTESSNSLLMIEKK